jgi:hypothetical protein
LGELVRSSSLFDVALDAESVAEAARKRAGLTDLGGDELFERLRALTRSLEEEAELHFLGRVMARENLIRVLVNRLRMRELWRKRPEILTRPVAPPVVIVGLQRTGTTLLHRLLATDPHFRVLRSWEAVNPTCAAMLSGRRGWRRRGRNARLRTARLAEWSLRYMAPDFFAIHPVEAHSPEEDCLLFDYALLGTVPEATQRVPSFSAWLERQDQKKAYRHLRRMLQTLDWQEPADRWLLKTPQHMEHLDCLLAEFPGARILWTHRDPVRVLASFCSMMAHSRGVFSDRVDTSEIGSHWFRKAKRMVSRSMTTRSRSGDDVFIDVLYADLVTEPMAVVRRVYDALGRRLQPDVERSMKSWLVRNPQHKHGKHRYRLEDFGLDRGEVRSAFDGYRRAYGIPEEPLEEDR